jgi:signal transduction histidine kinase
MVVQVFLKTDNVNIFFAYPPVLPMIKLDLEQMLIVFQNIVENAEEAMPDGGNLNIKAEIVSTEQKDQKDIKFLRISFEDTGIGILVSYLPKVFDPYFTTKAMGGKKGVGLGLATAQAIVARHGGDIYINSSIGKGTKVIVSLPLE